jgi:effector-binding domain-containing protein
MLDTPRSAQTAIRPSAIIRLTIPGAEIRNVMARAAVAAQGTAPTGPVFTHHLGIDPDTFDFEIGVPVAVPIAPAGRVAGHHATGALPAATVARTVYHGGYEGLGPAWAEFDAWIAAAGHTPGPDRWECYVAGPESNPDPATGRTALSRPLTR